MYVFEFETKQNKTHTQKTHKNTHKKQKQNKTTTTTKHQRYTLKRNDISWHTLTVIIDLLFIFHVVGNGRFSEMAS